MNLDTSASRPIAFCDARIRSLGKAHLWILMSGGDEKILFHDVKRGTILALLSLTDLDRLQNGSTNFNARISSTRSQTHLTFDPRYGLLFLRWKPKAIYTKEELRKLQQKYGHRSAQQLLRTSCKMLVRKKGLVRKTRAGSYC